ncbi:hypothetical protein OIU76_016957 [Salix suchowensis]|nr:hypothetical protein OIU76_016957 [Salix suchowensis]
MEADNHKHEKGTVPIPTQQAISTPGFSRFFSKSSPRYLVKVGIPEFLNGIGKGVEAHVAKLESEIGDFHKLLVTRTLKLKKLGIPCQQVIFFYIKKFMFVFAWILTILSSCNLIFS